MNFFFELFLFELFFNPLFCGGGFDLFLFADFSLTFQNAF
ncbi:hypothetical protein N405_08355 [Helicobacter pylori FD568]|nr:hypothetical protein N405_08355 [Helicobacter pylori FD568]